MLIDALKTFEGTMLFVSHDREFLGGLSKRVPELGGESGVDVHAHAIQASYVECVAHTEHEAPASTHDAPAQSDSSPNQIISTIWSADKLKARDNVLSVWTLRHAAADDP